MSFQARTTIPDHSGEPAPSRGARARLTGARGVSAASALVDANRAAELMQVPPSWLLSQARAGQVPHHKLGHYVRFDIDELVAWLIWTAVCQPSAPDARGQGGHRVDQGGGGPDWCATRGQADMRGLGTAGPGFVVRARCLGSSVTPVLAGCS